MADITNVEGMKYLFVPGAISAIAESIGGKGTGGAVIYGLDADWVRVSESAAALLQRLNLTSSFASLTRPDGSSVLINGKSVSVVRQPLPDDLEYAPQVHSMIFAGALKQALCESLDQVRQALSRVGVNL
ncbi:MAG: hypothetical protein ACYDAE_07425 [Steroidobacteraceae bacterium]